MFIFRHTLKNKNPYRMRILSFTLLFTLCVLSLTAQEKKALSLEDYKEWNRITNTTISPNGAWMTYTYAPNEGDTATFTIRELEGDKVYTAWNAKSVNFSADSKWLAFLVDPMET